MKKLPSEAPTHYGSLEGSWEYSYDYGNLDMAGHNEYRFNLIREGFAIEAYIMEKLRTFRQMKREDPNDDTKDDAIQTFMQCFKRNQEDRQQESEGSIPPGR